VVEIDLPDREAAKRWIVLHQLGKRNVPPDWARYWRGRLYNEAKQPHGGDRKGPGSSAQNEHLIATAEKLAGQLGVASATIRRDAQFAKAVDQIQQDCGPGAKQDILSGKVPVSRKEVVEVAGLEPLARKEAAKELLDRKACGSVEKKKRAAKEEKPKADKQPKTITLLTRPAEFVAALVKQLGPETAKSICLCLAKALGLTVQEKSSEPPTPPRGRPKKSGGKAAAKAMGKRGNRKTRSRS
jgi:hypothetical protein